MRVELEVGRGDVDVIQQPSAKNDWAAIIRIRDHSSGKDNYGADVLEPEERRRPLLDRRRRAREGRAKPVNTLHWTGSVDREMKIEWRGFDVQSHSVNGEAAREVHSSVSHALPPSDVKVEVSVRMGRGDVTIIQQPSASNGYLHTQGSATRRRVSGATRLTPCGARRLAPVCTYHFTGA